MDCCVDMQFLALQLRGVGDPLDSIAIWANTTWGQSLLPCVPTDAKDNLESFGVGDSELEQKEVSKCFAKTELHLCCQVAADSEGDAAELRMLFGRVPDSDDDLLLLL